MEEEIRTGVKINSCLELETIINIPLILECILKNLDNKELQKCKEVCSAWKKVAEDIMSERIFVINKIIPVSLFKCSVHEPCIMLQYLENLYGENFQFVTKYPENYGSDCKICNKLKIISAIYSSTMITNQFSLNRFSEKSLFLRRLFLRCFFTPPFDNRENQLILKMVIFPSLPEVQIHHFLFTSEEFRKSIKEEMSNFPEVINVPKEELKCVLWFIEGEIAESFVTMRTKFAMAGIFNRNQFFSYRNRIFADSKYSCITFSGRRVNASSFIFGNTISVKQKFEKLKPYKIDQNKCIAFLFSYFTCKCYINHILSAFKEEFSRVPILFCSESEFFGLNFFPSCYLNDKHLSFSDEIHNNLSAALVLIWIH